MTQQNATTLTAAFTPPSASPELLSPQAYQALLETLLGQGQGYGKTENVGAFLLQDIKLTTETSGGEIETEKKVAVEKLYIVMDLAQYPLEFARGLVVKDIAKNWGGKTIRERDLNDPDFKGPGLWTLKQGTFEADYLKAAESLISSVFKPNPDAYRVCLTAAEDVKIPVQWGDFLIRAGGTLAVREKDVAALADALQSIREGKATAEEALYTTDKGGKTVSRFDVYGMEPGFLGKNYNPVELKAATQSTLSTFKVAPKAPAGLTV
jgi:hypothetical protein